MSSVIKEKLEQRAAAKEAKEESKTIAGQRRLRLRELPPKERAYASCGAKIGQDFEESDPKQVADLQKSGAKVLGIYSLDGARLVIFSGPDPRKGSEPEKHHGKGK